MLPFPEGSDVEALTKRDLEILQLMARGLTNQAIASELVLAAGTVKWSARQIYGKLGVHSRAEAVAQALFVDQAIKLGLASQD